MDLKLSGKRALVTGSSSGIGAAIARELAAEGVMVVVHGRDEKRARQVAQEITGAGGKAFVAVGDLSTDSGAEKVASEVASNLGAVDILVNNAGGPEPLGWMEVPPDGWARIYNNNVISMVRMIRHCVPAMKRQGWGRIIQISSCVAVQPFASMPHHSAAKTAVLNLTVSLAKELAETGITVNTVSPGVILTPGAEKYFRDLARAKGWGDDWKTIERHVLLSILYNPTGRLGSVEDVAGLVAFVASPVSGYINGADLRVDGGSIGTIN
jgi:NAD(P)-dependent dehydrogenase (short-subunit alcohol dehydrogenase family)